MTKRTGRFIRGFCIAAILLTGLGRASADERSVREYQVKAAFLFHFAQFVDWPAGAFAKTDSPLVIAIVGRADPFNGALERAVRDKRAGGHPIQIVHYDSITALGPCNILFICDTEADSLEKILQKAGDSTLTVGDFNGFTDRGGVVRFFPEDEKVRFEVSLADLRRSRLRISAKLLKLAKIVHDE